MPSSPRRMGGGLSPPAHSSLSPQAHSSLSPQAHSSLSPPAHSSLSPPASVTSALPYRGPFGAARPDAVAALSLPPGRVPAHHRGRPLKAWHYLAFLHEDVMLCVTRVRIGPLHDAFWAVWDRETRCLWRGTGPRAGRVSVDAQGARIQARGVRASLTVAWTPGIETVAPAGEAHVWTRKHVGAAATLRLSTRGRTREFRGRAIVDDTVGYHARHTHWWWSAGAGRAASGAAVAWNLVSGINDAQSASERTVWVDGEPFEPPPSRFAADLTAVDGLTFHTEAQLSRRARLGPIRSDYHQPFGTFSGHLPGGLELAHGLGVMEEHDVWW